MRRVSTGQIRYATTRRSPRTGRRLLSGAAALLAALLSELSAATPADVKPPSKPGRPPSLILITVEGLRPDYLSCYGGKKESPTPGIDRIANRGTTFGQVVTPSVSTLPALATLMTGRTPYRHHVWDDGYRNRLAPSETTLAEILKGRGYRTAAFLGSSRAVVPRGFEQGFETYQDGYVPDADGTWKLTARTARSVGSGALSWLSAGRDKPFFLWIHLVEPVLPGRGTATQPAANPAKTYASRITGLDAEVSGILDGAKASMTPDDLVVLTADHGFGLGEHGENRAGSSLYEGTLRVPLVIGRPFSEAEKAKRMDTLTGLQDFLPTLLPLMGLPPGNGLEGRNLLSRADSSPAAYQASALEGREVFGWAASQAVAMGSWRLILRSVEELYDLAADPAEAKNLASARPEQVEILKRELEKIARGEKMPPAHFLSGPAPAAEWGVKLKGMALAPPTMAQAQARRLSNPPADPDRMALLEEMRLRADMLGYQALAGVKDFLLQSDPENLLALVGIAALQTQGDEASKKAARETLQRAQSLYPLESEVYHQLAHAAFPEKRYADAITLLKVGLQLQPRYPAELTYD